MGDLEMECLEKEQRSLKNYQKKNHELFCNRLRGLKVGAGAQGIGDSKKLSVRYKIVVIVQGASW